MTSNVYDPGDGTPMAVRVVNRDGTAVGGTGGTSAVDEAAFTEGASSLTPMGGIYNGTVDAITGVGTRLAAAALTLYRAFMVNLRDASGNEIASATSAPVGTERGLIVRIAGAAAGGTSSSFGAAVPAAGTAAGFSDGTNMQLGRAFDADTGVGTEYVAGAVLRKSASGGSVEAGTSSDPLRVDPTGTTAQPVTDNGGALTVDNGGTFAVQDSQALADDAAFTVATSKVFPAGFLADETATDSVDEGDVGAARMTLDRKVQTVVEIESASMRASGVSVTPKFAAIAAASSGDNTLVAAVASKKIRVLSIAVVAASAVNVYFTSAAAGTVIFGGSTNKMNLAANGGFVLPYNPAGWFENSSTNQALVMNLSGAVAVSGGLTYIEV